MVYRLDPELAHAPYEQARRETANAGRLRALARLEMRLTEVHAREPTLASLLDLVWLDLFWDRPEVAQARLLPVASTVLVRLPSAFSSLAPVTS